MSEVGDVVAQADETVVAGNDAVADARASESSDIAAAAVTGSIADGSITGDQAVMNVQEIAKGVQDLELNTDTSHLAEEDLDEGDITEPYQVSSIPPHLRGMETRTLSSVDMSVSNSEAITADAVVESSATTTTQEEESTHVTEEPISFTAEKATKVPVEVVPPPKMDAKFWVSIIFSLTSEADLRALGSTCKGLRSLVFDPSVVGSWLMRKSTNYLAIYSAYSTTPTLLTLDVLRHMMSLGAHIPRYLAHSISKEYGIQTPPKQKTDSSTNPEATIPTIITNESSIPTTLDKTKKLPRDTAQYIIWMGNTTFGNLTGFDAQSAAVASVGLGAEAPEVQAARSILYRDTLGWVYNLPRDKREEVATILGRPTDDEPCDAEVFLYMLRMYVADSPPQNDQQSKMPPSSEVIWGQQSDRSRIAASIRELANVYRFTPGLIEDNLPERWLPVDIFERDVELGWFLVRHSGKAAAMIPREDWEEISYRTLLGYRIHVNLNHPTLPPTSTDETFPFASIARLLNQRLLRLSDSVLVRLLREHPTQTAIQRLKKFVSPHRLAVVGEVLLRECFEGPSLHAAMSCGYVSEPLYRADNILNSFHLSHEAIARSFMGTPVDWVAKYKEEQEAAAASGEGKVGAGAMDSAANGTAPFDLPVGLLTRQAQELGYLPWVSWKWAIAKLGVHHPVASACLHDVCLRAFSDPAPINPGSHEGASFPRKETDAAVKAMVELGVHVQMCTASAILQKALMEIKVATISGSAAQAIKLQAATMKGGFGREAKKVVERAASAGAKAISRRYIYAMCDMENILLTTGAGELKTAGSNASTDSIKHQLMTMVSVPDEGTNADGTPKVKMLHLYPPTLLPQHRSVWLLALRTLVVDHAEWKQLTSSPDSPNAGRRFYMAVSNIIRGLEQFGVPAAALAVLRTKTPGGRALKSLSSNEISDTMLFKSWAAEFDAEDQKKHAPPMIKKKSSIFF
ncbi:hypothetical protein HDV05_007114 [Chytridiales sp. JEL 0842]|nr:hypothetical protein HDV05_007114 [Chytridiales sp. JEL 0842]